MPLVSSGKRKFAASFNCPNVNRDLVYWPPDHSYVTFKYKTGASSQTVVLSPKVCEVLTRMTLTSLAMILPSKICPSQTMRASLAAPLPKLSVVRVVRTSMLGHRSGLIHAYQINQTSDVIFAHLEAGKQPISGERGSRYPTGSFSLCQNKPYQLTTIGFNASELVQATICGFMPMYRQTNQTSDAIFVHLASQFYNLTPES